MPSFRSEKPWIQILDKPFTCTQDTFVVWMEWWALILGALRYDGEQRG